MLRLYYFKFKQYFLFGVPLQTSSFLHYGLAYTVCLLLSVSRNISRMLLRDITWIMSKSLWFFLFFFYSSNFLDLFQFWATGFQRDIQYEVRSKSFIVVIFKTWLETKTFMHQSIHGVNLCNENGSQYFVFSQTSTNVSKPYLVFVTGTKDPAANIGKHGNNNSIQLASAVSDRSQFALRKCLHSFINRSQFALSRKCSHSFRSNSVRFQAKSVHTRL